MRYSLKDVAESIVAALEIIVLLPLNPLLRKWYNRDGTTDAEVARSYDSDSLVPHPRQQYTRAITIHAPPAAVWSYLIQLGQERGGMYTYDLLENIAGCEMYTVDHIVPEWQSIEIGMAVRFGPKGKSYPLQKVVSFKPTQSLVLAGADLKTEQIAIWSEPMPENYIISTWAFYLESIGPARTRLITRSRLDFAGGAGVAIMWRVTEVLNFVMERKMLRVIKRLAERDVQTVKAQPALS
jgi:hypothetical protein